MHSCTVYLRYCIWYLSVKTAHNRRQRTNTEYPPCDTSTHGTRVERDVESPGRPFRVQQRVCLVFHVTNLRKCCRPRCHVIYSSLIVAQVYAQRKINQIATIRSVLPPTTRRESVDCVESVAVAKSITPNHNTTQTHWAARIKRPIIEIARDT